MEKLFLAGLQMISGIGTVKVHLLMEFFGDARQIWTADRADLLASGLAPQLCDNFIKQRNNVNLERLAKQWHRQGIRLISLTDANYPRLLKKIYNPPYVLFYKGSLPRNSNLIAIVGSRKATPYGKNAAKLLAKELAAAGIGIISGAARGIDTAAHQGALETGYTAAILGCGVDVVYPPENRGLYSILGEQGCLISEYPPGVKPHPGHFPARNRIISGLAKGVVVVEAAIGSGALITADLALEEGRDVFAVPGSIFNDTSRGTHKLIKQGAKLIDCVQDILDEYCIKAAFKQDTKLSPDETQLLNSLSADIPMSIDEVVMGINKPASFVIFALTQLELKGLVSRHAGQRYTRAAKEGIK